MHGTGGLLCDLRWDHPLSEVWAGALDGQFQGEDTGGENVCVCVCVVGEDIIHGVYM